MNKYSLSIKWKFNEEFESWNMIIISDDSKEHVTEVIKNYQKTNNVEFESPVDLMDAWMLFVMNTDGSGKIFIMISRLFRIKKE